MKLDCLIVDDEHSGRVTLEILLKDEAKFLGKIKSVSSLEQAIEIIQKETFDLCFLDIQLGDKFGFDLLCHLPASTKVIFVTAYSQYAIKALREKAFDYLLKPVSSEDLKNCLQRVKMEVSEKINHKHLLVKNKGVTIPIPFDEILYIEAKGPYSEIILDNNQKYTMAKTLKALISIVGDDFIRTHKSCAVNKKKIKSFSKGTVFTINDICLPVSRVGAKVLSKYF